METRQLGEFDIYINDGNYGNIYPSKEYFLDSGIPFISATDFDGKLFNYDGIKHVSEELHFNLLTKGHLKINDVLIVVRGNGIGKVGYFKDDIGECNINAQLAFIRTDPDQLNSEYLYYLFSSPSYRELIKRFGSGSAQPQLPINRLKLVPVIEKEITAQNNIAKVLSDLDSKIELNNKINAELEAMAKLIYDYWFVQFDFPDENGNPYKSSGGKMVYNQELKREIPDEWEVKELGDCISIFDNLRVPLSRSEREKIKGEIPYYGATDVMGYVNDFIFDDEYILLAEDGSVMNDKGMPIVQYIWGKTWVNNHAHVIQAKNKSHNEFIFQLVKMIPVVLIKTGSIQMKINQNNLKKYKVFVPSLDLIEKYSIKSSQIRKKLINNIEQNKKLIELRDWLLPMLMNGQVKVK